ncbi:MAG: hypothetical protein AAGM84_18635 [Pseudomonadota bacterium]
MARTTITGFAFLVCLAACSDQTCDNAPDALKAKALAEAITDETRLHARDGETITVHTYGPDSIWLGLRSRVRVIQSRKRDGGSLSNLPKLHGRLHKIDFDQCGDIVSVSDEYFDNLEIDDLLLLRDHTRIIPVTVQ